MSKAKATYIYGAAETPVRIMSECQEEKGLNRKKKPDEGKPHQVLCPT